MGEVEPEAMSVYYNEFDPKAAAWLRELISAGLIPAGDVDERSICDVQPSDLAGYVQCHFFAGIGGWSRALQLAGWPADKPVWTGSCPCQPFSVAGKGLGIADERHLWPVFFELVKACRPPLIFGEQVASTEIIGTQLEASFVDAVQSGDFALANRIANQLVKSPALHFHRRWLDGICADLEGAFYTCAAADLPAAGIGAPHIRQRLYWVAHSEQPRLEGHSRHEHDRNEPGRDGAHAAGPVAQGGDIGNWVPVVFSADCDEDGNCPKCGIDFADCGCPGPTQDGYEYCERPDGLYARWVGDSDSPGSQPGQLTAEADRYRGAAESTSDVGGVGDARLPESSGRHDEAQGSLRSARNEPSPPSSGGFWSDFAIIPCRDGKARRIPKAESFFQHVADGFPGGMDALRDSCGGQNEAEKDEIMSAIQSFPLAGKVPGRVMLLKGSGNAIVPELAAEFIRAVMEGEK